MAQDNVTRILDFLAEWAPGIEAIDQAIDRWFRPDTVWENVGIATTTGPEEAKAFLAGFRQKLPMAGIVIETHHIAATGNIVLTERTDHLMSADGVDLLPLAIMGIFELDDAGKIVAWRDYMDTAQFAD